MARFIINGNVQGGVWTGDRRATLDLIDQYATLLIRCPNDLDMPYDVITFAKLWPGRHAQVDIVEIVPEDTDSW